MSKPSDVQIGGGHYKKYPIQPAVFCQVNQLNFLESDVIKRVCRHRDKGGREDIQKAIHELELLMELEYPEKVDESDESIEEWVDRTMIRSVLKISGADDDLMGAV